MDDKSVVCEIWSEKLKKTSKIPWFLTLKLYLIGSMIVLPWNLMVNTLPSIRDILVHEPGKDTVLSSVALTSSFNCTILLASLFLVIFKVRSFLHIYVATILCLILGIGFLVAAVFLKVSINLVLSLLLVCMGVSAAFMSNNIMSFCAQMEPYAPGASDAAQGGIGFSGIFSFIVWLLLTRAIFFQYDDLLKVKYSFTGLGVTILAVGTCCIFALNSINKDKRTKSMRADAISKQANKEILIQDESIVESCSNDIIETATATPVKMSSFKNDEKSSFSETIIMTEKQSSFRHDITIIKQASFPYGSFLIPLQTTKEEAETIKTQSLNKAQLFLTIYPSVLNIFVTTLITCTLFPNLTPLKWTDLSTANQDIGVGMYQAGTFIGRGLPIIFKPLHRVPRWMFLTLIWARPVFFIIYYFVPLHLILKFIYILILAITNGLICTVESFYAVRISESLGVASQCSTAGWCISSISGGIAIGSLIALLLVQF